MLRHAPVFHSVGSSRKLWVVLDRYALKSSSPNNFEIRLSMSNVINIRLIVSDVKYEEGILNIYGLPITRSVSIPSAGNS
jgi:hypothetical protein